MQEFTVRAPTRIDLAGGTLDLWPIHRMLEHKATINIAISLFATTTVRLLPKKSVSILKSDDQQITLAGTFEEVCAAEALPLHRLMLQALWSSERGPLELRTHCQSPQGAGLGGSSSLAITIAQALYKARQHQDGSPLPSPAALVAFAQDIEATCLVTPTGIQDYWAAVNGGITIISYPPGGPTIKKHASALLPQLGGELIVCYSGKSRCSGINNWEIYRGVMDRDARIMGLLQEIGAHSVKASEAGERGAWEELLHHSAVEWQVRTTLCKGIETPETQRIHRASVEAGAYFTRVCGAGGGGVMAIFAPAHKKQQVRAAAHAAGGILLDALVTDEGVFSATSYSRGKDERNA
jgi:D-glycero-alpha-D-manno-heptose-7-phosphate kinase